MKVAWTPLWAATSLTMRRVIITRSAIVSALSYCGSISCCDGATSWWLASIGMPSLSSVRIVCLRRSLPRSAGRTSK